MWKVILFDLDGTLTDSGEGIMNSVRYALASCFGIETDDYRELRSFVGPPLRDKIMEYAHCTPEEADRAVRAFRERYVPVGIYENRLYAGIPEMLEALRREGFIMAVASSKPTAMCRQVLCRFGIEQYFSVILGSEEDGRRMDKASVIRDVISWLGMQDRRDEIILVGDTVYDITGAAKAGIPCICVTYGYGDRGEIERAAPYLIVDSPADVAGFLIGRARAAVQAPPRFETPPVPPVMENARPPLVTGTPGILRSDGTVLFRVWRILYPLLIDVVLTYGTILLAAIAIAGTGYSMEDALNRFGTELTGAADALLIVVFVVLFRMDEEKRRRCAPWGQERILKKRSFGILAYAAVGLFILCCSEWIGIFVSLIPFEDPKYEAVESMLTMPPVPVQIVIVGLIGPIMEEFLFRGVLFRRIRDYLGFLPAAFMSGAAFGIVHGNLTQGLYAGILGVVLACLYEHYGTIAVPLAAHISNNLFSIAEPGMIRALGEDTAAFIMLALLPAGVGMFFVVFRRKKAVNAI